MNACVCALHCAQLLHTILHRAYLIISPLILQTVIIALIFPQIDIIGAMVIVWRVRGKSIRSVLCNIVCSATIVHSAMHIHINRPNSSLDWVLSHWAHFTVLRFIFVLCITV